jgi:hypothetical protein
MQHAMCVCVCVCATCDACVAVSQGGSAEGRPGCVYCSRRFDVVRCILLEHRDWLHLGELLLLLCPGCTRPTIALACSGTYRRYSTAPSTHPLFRDRCLSPRRQSDAFRSTTAGRPSRVPPSSVCIPARSLLRWSLFYDVACCRSGCMLSRSRDRGRVDGPAQGTLHVLRVLREIRRAVRTAHACFLGDCVYGRVCLDDVGVLRFDCATDGASVAATSCAASVSPRHTRRAFVHRTTR